jgi:hypothetical protein
MICRQNSGASMGDTFSLYHLAGKAGFASMCKISTATETCLNTLKFNVEKGRKLDPDFETEINDLFKKLEVTRNIQTGKQ